jgi:hypothetical protein
MKSKVISSRLLTRFRRLELALQTAPQAPQALRISSPLLELPVLVITPRKWQVGAEVARDRDLDLDLGLGLGRARSVACSTLLRPAGFLPAKGFRPLAQDRGIITSSLARVDLQVALRVPPDRTAAKCRTTKLQTLDQPQSALPLLPKGSLRRLHSNPPSRPSRNLLIKLQASKA